MKAYYISGATWESLLLLLFWKSLWVSNAFCQAIAKCQHFCVAHVVQLLSCVWFFATLWTAARQASLSFTISWSLLKLLSIESVMPSNHLVLCRPFLLLPALLWSMWSPRVGRNLVTEHQRSENFPTHPWACVVWTPTGALGLAAGKMGRGAERKREWWHPRAIRGQISTWGQTLYYLSLSGKEKTEGTVKKKKVKIFRLIPNAAWEVKVWRHLENF